MSAPTRSPLPVEPEEASTRGDLTIGEAAHRVYALFYNKRFGLLLILAMSLLTLFGVLFIQAPDVAKEDPAVYAQWLEQAKQKYGGWAPVLSALGIFTMFSSPAFTVVTGLLALSIIACTCHRIPNLWKQATQPHVHVREGFHDRARVHGAARTPQSPEEAYATVTGALRRRGFRVLADEDRPWAAYTDRFRWAPFGTVAAHAAFVIILAGVVVTGWFGFRNDDFVVPVGTRVAVGHGTGMEVEARAFTDTYHPDGRPADYYSELVLFKDGRQVADQTVRVNTPLKYDGVKFNQASFGVAADVTVKGQGADVRQSVPLAYSTEDKQGVYGKFEIPGKDLEVYVLAAASGAQEPPVRPGQLRVEVYPKGQTNPLGVKTVDQGATAQVADLTVGFDRERQYTGLMVAHDPGAPLVWLGSGLIMLGMCLTMFLRHHRIWVRVDADGDGSVVRLASPDRHDMAFERRFADLVASFGTPLTSAKAADTSKESRHA